MGRCTGCGEWLHVATSTGYLDSDSDPRAGILINGSPRTRSGGEPLLDQGFDCSDLQGRDDMADLLIGLCGRSLAFHCMLLSGLSLQPFCEGAGGAPVA